MIVVLVVRRAASALDQCAALAAGPQKPPAPEPTFLDFAILAFTFPIPLRSRLVLDLPTSNFDFRLLIGKVIHRSPRVWHYFGLAPIPVVQPQASA